MSYDDYKQRMDSAIHDLWIELNEPDLMDPAIIRKAIAVINQMKVLMRDGLKWSDSLIDKCIEDAK
jgi:hypothetical protein